MHTCSASTVQLKEGTFRRLWRLLSHDASSVNTALLMLYVSRCLVALQPRQPQLQGAACPKLLRLYVRCLQVFLGLLLMPPFVSVTTIILSHAKPIMVGAMLSCCAHTRSMPLSQIAAIMFA